MATHSSQYLIILVILPLVILLIASLTTVRHQSPTITSPTYTSPILTTSTPTSRSVADIIRGYLASLSSSVRDTAILILNSNLNHSSVIYNQRINVGSGSWNYVGFHAYEGLEYRIRIYVQDTCFIGVCDIGVKLVDKDNRVIKYFGRVQSVEYNVTLPDGEYLIYLDNTYSAFTSKTVDIVIIVYFTRYVMNDDAYKVVTIGLWVAENVNYVSDPRGFEYIAPSEETLRTRAGDCDDYAVLLASMYRSVGLYAAVGLIDTDGDSRPDHATALVHFNSDPNTVMEKLERVAQVLGIKIEGISYFNDEENGIWLVIDPPMTYGSKHPWYVQHEPYRLIYLVKP